MTKLQASLAAILMWIPAVVSADTYLLMAEEDGCFWCARWNSEIAPIYPKTAEGSAAPLQRYDLKRDAPDVKFQRRVTFTPTFILVKDGQELGRIEGYPGEDFFWGLLTQMLNRAEIALDKTG